MEKKKMAKVAFLTATLSLGGVFIDSSFYAEAQGSPPPPEQKKYVWCQRLTSWKECSKYGTGTNCTTGTTC